MEEGPDSNVVLNFSNQDKREDPFLQPTGHFCDSRLPYGLSARIDSKLRSEGLDVCQGASNAQPSRTYDFPVQSDHTIEACS